MSITVTLSPAELTFAAQVGALRRVSALTRQRTETKGTPQLDPWGLDIEGAVAEYAVAKWCGLHWQSLSSTVNRSGADVGQHIQVRRRVTDHTRVRMLLHDRDLDAAPYVFVTGRAPSLVLEGWCFGVEGKADRYRHPGDGRPCFLVPVEDLHPMEELRDAGPDA